MGKLLQHLKFLLYKNYLLKRRNKKATFYEIISVLYFVAILVVIRVTSQQDVKVEIPELQTTKFKINNSTFPSSGIAYTVNGNQSNLNDVIQAIRDEIKVPFYKFFSEDEMVQSYLQNTNFTIGLVFESSSSDGGVGYTIKMRKEDIAPVKQSGDWKIQSESQCRSINTAILYDGGCQSRKYLSSSFASLQTIVDSKIIQVMTKQGKGLPIKSSIQVFPKAQYTPANEQLKSLVGIYMVIAFSPYITFLLTNIVRDKELKIKESMKIMGLNTLAYWLSWFITYGILILIGCIITTVLLTAVKVFGDTQFMIILLMLLFYGLSIITLSFMLTPLFKKAKSAGMFGSLGTIILSTIGLIHNFLDTSDAVKWITSLLSPVALSLGLAPGLDYTTPLTWGNIASKGDFPALYGLIMLIFDTILYLLLAIYFDEIFPGEYGKARHPLFLFSASFWKSSFSRDPQEMQRQSSTRLQNEEEDDNADIEHGDIEKVSELGRSKVISIRNLKKIFKQGKKKPDVTAVDGVSFDVYEGQITALLGHNGAGKSTLISMLTGMLTPSSGRAKMYGYDIRNPDELDNVREMIGLCPQQNIIFDQLNPREHLTIYAGIKGVVDKLRADMVETLLKEIDLYDQAGTLAKDLSGGQKRKLCIGIALIGDPKIVFLDEPTSGMDPSSRRRIWALLQSKREGRVIFLTTHFMDEADILADHKAILSKGKVRCAGSSLFLKSRFGIGYHLGMVLEEGADVSKISTLVTQNVPNGTQSRQHGKELAFRLPLAEVDTFQKLFQALEEHNDTPSQFTAPKLGIVSYGVSMTTLEEVFLKLEEDSDEARTLEIEKGADNHAVNVVSPEHEHLTVQEQTRLNNASLHLHPDELNVNTNRKDVSLWLQVLALMEFRWKATKRSPAKIIFQMIIPPIILIIGLVLTKKLNSTSESSKVQNLRFSPEIYLQQGSSLGSSLERVLWSAKSLSSTDEADMLKGFTSTLVKQTQTPALDLLKQAPHVVAYNIEEMDTDGQLSYTLRWNSSQVHSIPVGINTMSNIMYHIMSNRSTTSASLKSTLPITTSSKPFPSTEPEWTYDAAGQIAIMLMGLAVVAMIGGFSIEPIISRQFGLRHQFRVSGLNRLAYWLQFYVYDMIFFIPLLLILFILIPAMDIKAFNNSAAMGAIFLLLLVVVTSNLSFIYTFSFLFSKFETAQSAIPTVNNLLALGPFFAVTAIDMASGSLNDKPLHATIAKIVCVVDPSFTMMAGLYYIARVYRVESILSGNSDVEISAFKYFGWEDENNALPAIYIIALFHLVVCTFLVYAIDSYKAGGEVVFPFTIFRNCYKSCCKKDSQTRLSSRSSTRRGGEGENEDVLKERERVVQSILEDQVKDTAVGVQGLKKRFGDKKVVRDVTFGVNKGEVFGLLGPNGAGKSTCLNIVTADQRPDSGQVFLAGHNTSYELKEAFENLGYCPQYDPLYEGITVAEHLKCFGLIKGVPRNKIDLVISHFADALKIREHLNKLSKELSGGTKRKLSFLIAMIGNGSVVIMDEPSTGMDPGARRFLWSVISANVKEDRGAILTTHSMEEADALCGRVGIIVKGQLKCIGTTQELKNNYGGGYQLEIKFKVMEGEEKMERKNKIQEFVTDLFALAVELEYFGSRITYKIPNENVQALSKVFCGLEAGKASVAIEEYNFSQSSLEQVFLEFAKEQDDDATGKTDKEAGDDDDDDENVRT